MNPKVQDFPALIRWIAETYHGGAVHPIHEKVGVSPALVQLWATGGVRNPTLENLDRLCAAYELNFTFVRGLLRQRPHPIAGGSSDGGPLPLPNLAEILPLIGRWLRARVTVWAWPLLLHGAHA